MYVQCNGEASRMDGRCVQCGARCDSSGRCYALVEPLTMPPGARAEMWRGRYEEVAAQLAAKDAELTKWKRIRTPTHGSCCTCQRCGLDHESCRCDLDDAVDDLEQARAALSRAESALAAARRDALLEAPLFFDGWYATKDDARNALDHCLYEGARGIGLVEGLHGWGYLYTSGKVLFENHRMSEWIPQWLRARADQPEAGT